MQSTDRPRSEKMVLLLLPLLLLLLLLLWIVFVTFFGNDCCVDVVDVLLGLISGCFSSLLLPFAVLFILSFPSSLSLLLCVAARRATLNLYVYKSSEKVTIEFI